MEEDVYLFARGSVVADKELEKGAIIDEADIWARRPGSGEIADMTLTRLSEGGFFGVSKEMNKLNGRI